MIVFAVMGGLVAAYLFWLVVHGSPAPQSGWINGWAEDAFYLAAGVVCVIGGLRRRPESPVPLVFGLALISTSVANTILTVYALHGMPPPPPSLADPFGLGFIALCFVGIALMAREDRQRLNPRDLLDGGIAALGAGAVGAAFVLAHLPHRQGQSTLGTAVELAYPIGFVVLVLIVVGAATVASKRSRAAWVALTAAFVLLALASALNAATGPPKPRAIQIVVLAAWPAALLLVAASMWADPGVLDPLAVRKGTTVWIPALACGMAIAVLFTATFTRVDHAATALAAGALLLVALRGVAELRQEITARERNEESLRATEAGYSRVADEQAALRRVATLVAQAVPTSEVFEAVSREVGLQCDADLAWMERFEEDRTVTAIATWSRSGQAELAAGTRFTLDGPSVAAQVHATGQPARVDTFSGLSGAIAREAQALGIRSAVGCPIVVGGRTWGVIAAFRTREAPFPPKTESRIADFTGLVATAVSNAEARNELIASRTRLVTAGDDARRRVVRELHDGAQAGLVHAILTLKLAQNAQDNDDEEGAKELVCEALEHAEQANTQLRELSHGIIPTVLARAGLAAGIEELASRARLPISVAMPRERFEREVEAGAYFVVAEALTNVAKHSGATGANVSAWVDDGVLHVEVRDDGVGGACPDGAGLLGLHDRVAALGGQLRIDSPPGRGTRITATLPLDAHEVPSPAQRRPAGEALVPWREWDSNPSG